jgi:hypothetical protein
VPKVRLGVGFSELFKLRNGNQGVIEMTKYIEKFWQDATVSDLVRVMESETVEARFADDGSNWVLSKLRGWRSSRRVLDNWIDDDGARWDRCQVYAPPQWYLNKPEPGEGYRLLGKFPDEALQPGDEVRMPSEEKWRLSDLANVGGTQHEVAWYRRRIEQPKPEPKHYVLQVGDTAEFPDCTIVEALEKGVWLLK